MDESGDTGLKTGSGSSSVFVVAIVVFRERSIAEAVDERICLLRHEQGLKGNFEFHFSKNSKRIKEVFLNAIAGFDFSYYGIVIQKENLHGEGFKNKESFYKYACKLVFQNAQASLCNAIVILDRTGNKDFNRALSSYLKRELNTEAQCIAKIKAQDSRKNNLVQLADMICGAVHCCYKDPPRELKYRHILKEREAYIQVWPRKE
jgi:hypothetical protein